MAYLWKKLYTVAREWPPCIFIISSTAYLVEDVNKLTLGQELEVTTPHLIEWASHWSSVYIELKSGADPGVGKAIPHVFRNFTRHHSLELGICVCVGGGGSLCGACSWCSSASDKGKYCKGYSSQSLVLVRMSQPRRNQGHSDMTMNECMTCPELRSSLLLVVHLKSLYIQIFVAPCTHLVFCDSFPFDLVMIELCTLVSTRKSTRFLSTFMVTLGLGRCSEPRFPSHCHLPSLQIGSMLHSSSLFLFSSWCMSKAKQNYRSKTAVKFKLIF